jgi:phage virion morphogenesis protein
MIEIRLDDAAVQAALQQLAARLTDMTPAMQEIGEVLMTSTKDRVLAGQQPDGGAFAPRSPVTLARYERLGLRYGNPLNQSGMMRGGIFAESGPDQVQVGSNAIQSAVMQFGAAKGSLGARSPWGNIPARPFLGISDSDRSAIGEIVAEWIDGAVQ